MLRSSVPGMRFLFATVALLTLVSAAAAQTATRDLEAYLAAIKQPRAADHIAALEKFVSTARSTQLKLDALDWLLWDYQRARSPQSLSTAEELLQLDSNNALALAALSDNAEQAIAAGHRSPADTLSLARRGLANIERLRKPEGMRDSEFGLLKEQTTAVLAGALGQAEVEGGHYLFARLPLRRAVAAFPKSPQYAYALGVADLHGENPDSDEGFWYLARAVNLTRGTPAGERIAAYSSKAYEEAGGTAAQWRQFVAAAVLTAPYRPAPALAQKTTAPEFAQKPPRTRVAEAKRTPRAKQTTKVERAQKHQPNAAERTDLELPGSIPARSGTMARVAPRAGGPISLGILIEAHDIKADRKALLNGLSDIVRSLRPGEEAFILSFGQELEFDQDLTANYRLLEDALSDIKPRSGAALYDAVAFAAGHLKRIAKNPNRVLLIISDGRNAGNKSTPFGMQAEIGGVRIYCIGMDVNAANGKYLLSALASHTGGWASFISDPRQFPAASRQMAQVMGIATPF